MQDKGRTKQNIDKISCLVIVKLNNDRNCRKNEFGRRRTEKGVTTQEKVLTTSTLSP